ncbi:hypothetical protein C8J55DRAFT_554926 [Lentinula edodes]|uniref:AAA+ ATPase domain-containing protein n=1 Tax=Lentinula lateritia TaxID=40482 RepID=A0A9W9E008_9AGAR|nr:hypothetical protein C8J55DRAFT_554926 [Lentinula edodes]
MLLNKEQQKVKDVLKSSVLAYLKGEDPEQVLLLVHGPSGMGKTTVLEAIATLFDDMDCSHIFLKASPTKISCSALSAKVLQKIATSLWDPEDLTQDIIPFGHRSLILFGDFSQHPPIEHHWDTLWWPNYEASDIVQHFLKHVIVFHQDMTGAPTSWVNLTHQVRNRTLNGFDRAALNECVVGLYSVPRVDDLSLEWTDGVVIASNAVQRQYWNINMASRVSRASRKPLYITTARDEYVFGDGERMGVRDLEVLSTKLKREFSVMQSLYLFEGMPVVILHGELHNVWGQIINILLDKREKRVSNAAEHRLAYAVKEVTVQLSAEAIRS